MRLAALALTAALALPGAVAAADASLLDGVWEGGYTCAQGKTFLRLTLDGMADGRVTGTFFFSSAGWAGGQNLTVPDGSFRVEGRLEEDSSLTLRGVSWIQQPAGYGMVDLIGGVRRDAKGLFLKGRVTGAPACTTWEVVRPGS